MPGVLFFAVRLEGHGRPKRQQAPPNPRLRKTALARSALPILVKGRGVRNIGTDIVARDSKPSYFSFRLSAAQFTRCVDPRFR